MPGCKVGDLAKVLCTGPNQGAVVYVREEAIGYLALWEGLAWVVEPLQPVADVKLGYARAPNPNLPYVCCDKNLQPIRPGDLEGEHPGDKLIEPVCSDSLVHS